MIAGSGSVSKDLFHETVSGNIVVEVDKVHLVSILPQRNGTPLLQLVRGRSRLFRLGVIFRGVSWSSTSTSSITRPSTEGACSSSYGTMGHSHSDSVEKSPGNN